MQWDERRALRATMPSDDGLARLGIDLGAPVVDVDRLAGGVASSTHALRLADGTEVVLKRFVHDPDPPPLWQLEWERLHLALAAPIATPTPIALDDDGRWFDGIPALVMSRLPGRASYPIDPAAIGRALARIHSTVLPSPVPDVALRPPYWDVVPPQERVLCHGDLHPGNVLVAHDDPSTVVGIVDWSGCRLAARGMDVGIARADVAIWPGGDAPDVLLEAYEAAAGVRIEHLSLWDEQAHGRVQRWCPEWLDSWAELGMDITEELVREQMREFLSHPVRMMRP